MVCFFFQAEDGIRDGRVTGVQTCALPILAASCAFAVIGVGLGALIRNVVGAVALALAWIALIEGIAGQLVGSGLARWLPFYASQALDQPGIASATRLLPQWGFVFVLLGYAAAFAAFAVLGTLRCDFS